MTHRERFFAAIHGQPVDHVPVFPLLMFFAVDRYGLSYREFAGNGRALADAQLAVQRKFGLDAITACSDAYRVAADLGGEMEYPESHPPHLVRPVIETVEDIGRLGMPDPTGSGGRMGDRVLAVSEMVRGGSDAAVLGWTEMPFAEACALCGLSNFMMMMVDEPEAAHAILEFVTGIDIEFALAQMAVGADMIGAGDAAASLISLPMYDEFALPYERRVCDAIHAAGGLVKLHVCGNTTALLPSMAGCGADLFNVDHMVPLDAAKQAYAAAGKCFKGNLDPVDDIMRATPEECRAAARSCISLATGSRYMLSAGCEIPAETSDETFAAFCGAVID